MAEDEEAPRDETATADSQIDHEASLKYWNSRSPDENGMLGGYPQISRIDLRGSRSFVSKICRLSSTWSKQKMKLGVDCGAGIGRVTHGLLTDICDVVDVVEPIERFAKVLRDGSFKRDGKVGDIYTTGLEEWMPDKNYDLIWNQWCVGYLMDKQLVSYLRRCGSALSSEGLIVVKENLSTLKSGKDMFDDLDSSVTRSDEKFRDLFDEAGLHLVKAELQTGFPRALGLYPVKMYALRPR